MRFVFRHFPLSDKHPLAQQAAEAAEAAASQGQFWTMHDLLFEHQDALEIDDLYRYADVARLDLSRFKEDLDRRVHVSRVMHDVTSGRRSGVTGTPTFFLTRHWYRRMRVWKSVLVGRATSDMSIRPKIGEKILRDPSFVISPSVKYPT